MKLTYFQLEPHIAKNLSPIYLIAGEDVLLKQDSMRIIQKAAKQAGFIEKIRLSIETDSGEQLYNALYSSSLFSEKRLIELHLPSLSHQTIATILQEYVKNPSAQQLLLIHTGKIDTKTAKTTCYRAMEEYGIVIAIWPLSREQLLQWIHQKAKKYRLQFTPAAAHLLANFVEGNLIAAAQVIEKCYLLQPQNSIDENFIESILVDETQFTIFDYVDSIIAGNVSRSLHILSSLKLNNTEPTLIIWAIARELRLLNDISQQLKQGASFEELFKKYHVLMRRQFSIKKFLSTFGAKDCNRFLLHITTIDRSIKGATLDNPWNQLQLLCLKMAKMVLS
ncbi:MAG: DNA polymerase III subunit delta [Gammaproteobacteria bacterium RIFCSPHIGHO2_12_FULL_37_34]|nr:MAG: DNA polymerase III subunit delta [Gammaproteobacteria bacterium RIFCSPHIGHO2_12_FULL_37_34]